MNTSGTHNRTLSSAASFSAVPRSGSVSDMLNVDGKFALQTKKPVSALGKMSRYYSHHQLQQQHQQYQNHSQQQQYYPPIPLQQQQQQEQQYYPPQQQPYPDGYYQQQPPYPQENYGYQTEYQQQKPPLSQNQRPVHSRRGEQPHRHSNRSRSKTRPRPSSQLPNDRSFANSSFNNLSTYNQPVTTFHQQHASQITPVSDHQNQHPTLQSQPQPPNLQNYSSSSNSSTSLKQKAPNSKINLKTSPFTNATSTSELDQFNKTDMITEMDMEQKSTENQEQKQNEAFSSSSFPPSSQNIPPIHQRTRSVVANVTPKLPIEASSLVPLPTPVTTRNETITSESQKRSNSLRRTTTEKKKPGLLKRIFSFKKNPSQTEQLRKQQQPALPSYPSSDMAAATAAARKQDLDIDADQRPDRRQRRASSMFSLKSFSRSRSQSVSAKTSPQKQNRYQPPQQPVIVESRNVENASNRSKRSNYI